MRAETAGHSTAREQSANSPPWRRNIGVMIIALCAVACALVASNVLEDRKRRFAEAHREAVALARVLEEQTASILRSANIALLSIAEELRRSPGLEVHDDAFASSLRRMLGNLPAIRGLFVIGPDGRVIQDSYPDTQPRNVADRDYFRAHVENANRGFFVGDPAISRLDGTWFVGLSRRLHTAEGKFAGVIAAALEVDYFERLYEDLGLESGDAITLVKADTTLIARQPQADDRTGQRLIPGDGQSVLKAALARAPQGTFDKLSAIDGVARLFGYRAFESYPLVVVVGLSEERVLLPWLRQTAVATAETIATLAFAALLLWFGVRHARREASIQARMAGLAKMEAVGQLTSGVAHDFNNLLQTMSAALRLLAKLPHDHPHVAEVVDQGLKSVDRGRSLVARLLGVARPQLEPAQLTDINAEIAGMEALMRSAASPAAQVSLELADDVPKIRADASRLDAALLNLVVNARDSMANGHLGSGLINNSTASWAGFVGSHDGRRQRRGRFVRITVRDNGAGMPAEVRMRVLEPFFTTKRENGTGLGLPQVYAFVREIGGEMQIESEVGRGTAVHIYIPAVD